MLTHIIEPVRINVKKSKTKLEHEIFVMEQLVFSGSRQKCLTFLLALRKVLEIIDLGYDIQIEKI